MLVVFLALVHCVEQQVYSIRLDEYLRKGPNTLRDVCRDDVHVNLRLYSSSLCLPYVCPTFALRLPLRSSVFERKKKEGGVSLPWFSDPLKGNAYQLIYPVYYQFQVFLTNWLTTSFVGS